MNAIGPLHKMRAVLGPPVRYTLTLGEQALSINDLIGQPVSIRFEGEIRCVHCGRRTRKSYGQGHCYPCFKSAPGASPCIVRPELCRAHEGVGRDPAWEEAVHNQPHVVYLAISGGLKVGVTREAQVPTRWIDQGASEAVVIAEVPYRQLAGAIEVALKAHFSDRTAWQRMLTASAGTASAPGQTSLFAAPRTDLGAERDRALAAMADAGLGAWGTTARPIVALQYPLTPPSRVSGANLTAGQTIAGTLDGIRGQYLLFDGGRAFNVRRHAGYVVELAAD